MRNLSLQTKEFLEGIEEYEKTSWFADYVYLETISQLDPVRKDLSKLEEWHLSEIVHTFLTQWGQMARVLNQTRDFKWGKIALRLKAEKSSYENVSGLNILSANLSKETINNSIKSLYEALDYRWKVKTKKGLKKEKELGLKATCISKTLHLLNPRLFVMWDSNIRNGPNSKETWSEYYVRFMAEEKVKLTGVLKDLGIEALSEENVIVGKLCEKLGPALRSDILKQCEKKSLVKLLDEYEWWKANREDM